MKGVENKKAQGSGVLWLIVGAIVMILVIVIFMIVTGKLFNVSKVIVKSLGG